MYQRKIYLKSYKIRMLDQFEIPLAVKGVKAARFDRTTNKFKAHDIIKGVGFE